MIKLTKFILSSPSLSIGISGKIPLYRDYCKILEYGVQNFMAPYLYDLRNNSILKKLTKDPCCHCELNSFAYNYTLKQTANFSIVCDVHPLVEGHLLIIPKSHLSCIGAYSKEIWEEFILLYEEVVSFTKSHYGPYCTFEHGIIGQTVFHSHLHILPSKIPYSAIITEGPEHLTQLRNLGELRKIYLSQAKYLFVSFESSLYSVNTELGAPRFFRDRFANALGVANRGNWKEMRENLALMQIAREENMRCKSLWKRA